MLGWKKAPGSCERSNSIYLHTMRHLCYVILYWLNHNHLSTAFVYSVFFIKFCCFCTWAQDCKDYTNCCHDTWYTAIHEKTSSDQKRGMITVLSCYSLHDALYFLLCCTYVCTLSVHFRICFSCLFTWFFTSGSSQAGGARKNVEGGAGFYFCLIS